MTVARWMREFIANHPDYKQDKTKQKLAYL